MEISEWVTAITQGTFYRKTKQIAALRQTLIRRIGICQYRAADGADFFLDSLAAITGLRGEIKAQIET